MISDDGVAPTVTDDAPTFDIPHRPKRVYSHDGVEYEGGTVFKLSPDPAESNDRLAGVVERVLSGDRYTYGDWFELPAPVYLVHDERDSSVFRVVIRSGTVEFHVLPDTAREALRGLYDRLREEADCAWRVDCELADTD
ncbi:hypothetical protein [Halorussus litoreus]|uniref:hypothetical protein n=1 Tax=Halorussus litoreus TaxID=1710536 RepID=UPI001E582D6A|nr:hypothetical protein [Halorussus litoreus]